MDRLRQWTEGEGTDENPAEGHMSSICYEHHLKKIISYYQEAFITSRDEDCELVDWVILSEDEGLTHFWVWKAQTFF